MIDNKIKKFFLTFLSLSIIFTSFGGLTPKFVDAATSRSGTYALSASITPTKPIVSQPLTVNLKFTNSGSGIQNGIVQVEFFSTKSSTRLFSKTFTGQNISSSQPGNYSVVWTPNSVGDYYIKAGIFSSDWKQNPFWTSKAITFSVIENSGSTGTATGSSTTTSPVVPPTDSTPSQSSFKDKFGVDELYGTVTNGTEWFSNWANGIARTFTGIDPKDPWFDAGHGDATYKVDGNGLFSITGSIPRMYIHDPAHEKSWGNVEMTVYAKRVSDSGTAYGGIVGVARSNHGTTAPELNNLCDTRGVGARIRYDGHVDFEKETSHPNSVPVANKTVFSNGMPYNTWIGYKYVVYDLPDGNVKVELWMDLTDGLNGGDWKKINEFTDNGSNFGVGGVSCKSGISPTLKLTAGNSRAGSESGKPNITVYFRSDNVGTNGLVYKKMSVREINPNSILNTN